jgi:hypothetical protein
MNIMPMSDFTLKEVNVALSQMHPLKAPGPDGYGVCFYQKHWDTVGGEAQTAVLDFLNNGIFDPLINSTFIALIPKKSLAATVCDYRHISLRNVLYKLITKVLANRLEMVLPSKISQHQSAFVPGHLITDNIFVAYEALHSMNTRIRGKKGYMAIKLDMSREYN